MSVSTSVGPGAASSTVCTSRGPRLYWDCGVEAFQQNPLTVIVIQAQNCLHSLLVDLVEDEKVYFHSLTVNRQSPHQNHGFGDVASSAGSSFRSSKVAAAAAAQRQQRQKVRRLKYDTVLHRKP